MSTKGFARKMDELGRVVLPMEYRRQNGINPGDEIEFDFRGASVVLTPVKATCVFCGKAETLVKMRGLCICKGCTANAAVLFKSE